MLLVYPSFHGLIGGQSICLVWTTLKIRMAAAPEITLSCLCYIICLTPPRTEASIIIINFSVYCFVCGIVKIINTAVTVLC